MIRKSILCLFGRSGWMAVRNRPANFVVAVDPDGNPTRDAVSSLRRALSHR